MIATMSSTALPSVAFSTRFTKLRQSRNEEDFEDSPLTTTESLSDTESDLFSTES